MPSVHQTIAGVLVIGAVGLSIAFLQGAESLTKPDQQPPEMKVKVVMPASIYQTPRPN